MRLSRLAIATAAVALLAACGEEAPSDDSRAATGEVLEGTISDAMLPLDQVRSQPPLIAPRPRSMGTADGGDGEPVEDEASGVEGTAEASGEEAAVQPPAVEPVDVEPEA